MSKLIFLLFLIGCGSAPIDPNARFKNVDKRTIKYVKIFEKHWGQKIPMGTTLVVEDIESKNAGGYYNRIEDVTHINIKKWEKWDSSARLMIIAHELGHALLKRGHIDNWNFRDGCPDSVMFWAIRTKCFKKYKDHYMIELFMPDMDKFYPYNKKK